MEARLTKKFEIGQRWRCRNGSRAIILKVEGNYLLVWSDYCDGVFRLGPDGLLHAGVPDDMDLIEPWTEKRSMEVEVFMYDRPTEKPMGTFVTTLDLHSDHPRCKLLARKKITITEGEGI